MTGQALTLEKGEKVITHLYAYIQLGFLEDSR